MRGTSQYQTVVEEVGKGMRVTKDTVKAFCRKIESVHPGVFTQPSPQQLEMLNESSRLTIYGGYRCPGKTHRAKLLRDILAEAHREYSVTAVDELVNNTERLGEAQ